MGKIIVSILAYNSEPFMKYCLDSIYSFADKIVIVEGTYGTQRAFGKRSTDRTIEIIKNYPDNDKKITLIFCNDKEHEHRNAVLKFCEPGDWFFTVHTDEMYKHEDLKKLKTYLNADKNTDVFKMIWYNFYLNFNLYLEEISPPRIYRIKPGCYFDYKDTLVTKEGIDYDKLNCETLPKDIIIMYHYGYITNIREKIRYYKKGERWYHEVFSKFSPETADEVYTHNAMLTGEEKGIHLHGGGILKPFTGTHPECMTDHPLKDRDLVQEFKNGYEEPFDKERGYFDNLITNIKRWYYNKKGN